MYNKILVPVCGKMQCGLGDLFRNYLKGHYGLGYLESLKEKYPKSIIKTIVSCHNPEGVELFTQIPYIDKVEKHPWKNRCLTAVLNENRWYRNNGWTPIHEINLREEGLIFKTPKIYLSPDEKIRLERIKARGPFVVVHPFAGVKDRMPMNVRDYELVINELIDNMGIQAIIVGGTYTRGARLKTIPPMKLTEKFNYKRKGLVNMVNNSRGRLAAQLVRDSLGFIGTWSCFLCVAWQDKKPSLVVGQHKHIKILSTSKGYAGRWHDKCIGIPVNSRNRRNSKASLRDKAMKFFSKELKNAK